MRLKLGVKSLGKKLCFEFVFKTVQDDAYLTSSGRQFHAVGDASLQLFLPAVIFIISDTILVLCSSLLTYLVLLL